MSSLLCQSHVRSYGSLRTWKGIGSIARKLSHTQLRATRLGTNFGFLSKGIRRANFCGNRIEVDFPYFRRSRIQTFAHSLTRCQADEKCPALAEDGAAEDCVSHAGVPKFVSNRNLSEVCTWGIGGPAKYFIEVHNEQQMSNVLRYCCQEDIRFFVIGNGSNCLFDDQGYDGCVILNRISFVEDNGAGIFRVGSGYPFNTLGVKCSKLGYAGLEFASGIPGTVGGAVYMNAGADGQETSEVLHAVEFVTSDGKKRTLTRENGELEYGYRSSPFQSMEDRAVIVSASFKLTESVNARQRQSKLMDRRRKTQPVHERTAGCVFRNPGQGYKSAGAIIDQLGLKGHVVGGARISEIHANFLVNDGGSKCSDVQALIETVKQRAKADLGVDLQEEILYVPFR